MMLSRSRFCLLFLTFAIVVNAQQGGKSVFQSLTLAPSARTLALGGKVVSVQDSDIVLSLINPAVAYASSTRQVAINQSFYYSGSKYTTLVGAHHLNGQQMTITGALQYLNHGDIISADEFGNKIGTFAASEYTVVIGASKKLFDPLSIGIHLKYIGSKIESYSSQGIGIDLGALYVLKSGRQSLGLSIRNIGSQWNYYQDAKEPMPFDILLGFSHRLKYVPFRLTMTGHHLQTWSLRSEEEEQSNPIFGDQTPSTSAFSKVVDNLARHLIWSGEIYLGKYAPIRIRLSYDHQRHQELKDLNYGGLGGFSTGIGIKVSRMMVDYSVAQYHLAGAVHALGIGYKWK